MSTYVIFRCGGMTLYIDARAVQAIADLDTGEQGELTEWEGRAVAKVDLGARLGRSAGRGEQGLLVAADKTTGLTMLTVDSVENVVELDAGNFRALPPISGRLKEFFDAGVDLGGHRGLGLRLRHPLPGHLVVDGA